MSTPTIATESFCFFILASDGHLWINWWSLSIYQFFQVRVLAYNWSSGAYQSAG
jgi:hypothetical protein